ncbi:MAG TPA: L,D-transpeptidase [Candidatus Sulfopaludibacter sp.]|jgi:lipoprotein-anchoring transpeptidase ErfK/SrfK|nr:L,D-transpeptidase [Candidatus Sulfopaludibacter sp.]
MLRVEDQVKKLAAFTGVLLMATAEALAQEKQSQPVKRIVVSIPDRKLAVIQDGKVVKVFSTAVGAPQSPSPTGSFKIILALENPTWYGKGKIVPPGKNNPIGTRWLGINLKGYGIHGTNVPTSIGHNVSHGCIRLRNHDVEELFTMVGEGDVVDLVGERTAETAELFGSPKPATIVAAATVADNQL